MPRTSAGLLPYRRRQGRLEVLLVHPGGPFWDTHAWSVAKGEVEPKDRTFLPLICGSQSSASVPLRPNI
jgi:predicted NUDIX family NTP pyrophosphohydrolase